ncbi:hypothetical protein C8A05DRAFT_19135 [Staphylotrichum tortipilum]|uniref:Uncharacterized protein n=1 Tax=Staphylotrichum tortipilum TaxID=2831512 RepID=A0AAN6ME22_9PEZI|nr:hypothetical protein C8A05DRAFT_19135 [Staphylotrichum longicolle]
MAQPPPPSFSSNNPFRRRAAVAAPVPPTPAAPLAMSVPRSAESETPSLAPETAAAHTLSPPPAADLFRTQLESLSASSYQSPPPTTSFQKPRVIKKVRVQSPPSSPESPGASGGRFPPVNLDDDDESSSEGSSEDYSGERVDPFAYALSSATGSAGESEQEDKEDRLMPAHQPPPNPFQKTLHDIETGVKEPEQSFVAAPRAKAALDVAAFRNLLLTGQTGSQSSAQPPELYAQRERHPPTPTGDQTGTPHIVSAARKSIYDTLQVVQASPQTSREASEQETEDDRRGLISSPAPSLQPAPTIVKKKPPPPSSRHGKLINPVVGSEVKDAKAVSSPSRRAATMPLPSPSRQGPPTPSDVNKPLPAAPHRSPQEEEEAESVFDRAAAGQAPELEVQPGLNIIMPTSSPSTAQASVSGPVSTPQTQAPKKPVPPPRRQPHGRSESKIHSSAASILQEDGTDSSLRRSSFDSTRSRSSSLRVSVHAPPAPPPPRRAAQTPRGSSSSTIPPATTTTTAAPHTDPIPSSILDPSLGPAFITATPPPLSEPSSSTSNSIGGTPTPAAQAHHPHPLHHHHHSQSITGAPGKLIPPPPPPARNASLRARKRPVSMTPEAGVRRATGGKEPPPPPKHRNRGGSWGALDGQGGEQGGEQVGGEGSGLQQQPQPHQSGIGAGTGVEASAAGDILADLSALQREVDALRGKVEKGG